MKNFIRFFTLPWMKDKTPDAQHFYRRGFTPRYIARKKKIRDLWIGGGVIVLSYPVPAVFTIIGLLCCFITFAFLDEGSF